MSERVRWIGLARGLLIVLVVVGHALPPAVREGYTPAWWLWQGIYNFHMPLFFFFSGWLYFGNQARYAAGSNRVFVGQKAALLMLPYLAYSLVFWLLVNGAHQSPRLSALLGGAGYPAQGLVEFLLQTAVCFRLYQTHLWFVYALFLIFVLVHLGRRFLSGMVGTALFGALFLLQEFELVRFPWILHAVAQYGLFFQLGRFGVEALSGLKRRGLDLAALAFLPLCIIETVYIRQRGMERLMPLELLFDLAVPAAALCFLYRWLRGLPESRLAWLLESLQAYSYDIYLMHQPFLVSGGVTILVLIVPWLSPVVVVSMIVAGILLPVAASRYVLRRLPLMGMVFLGRPRAQAQVAR